MRRRIDVETLVQWTYRDELPKALPISPALPSGFGGPWGSIIAAGALGITVRENRYGLVPDFSASREPKDDAIRVWQAVQDLDRLEIALPDDWRPLSDMGELGPLGAAAVVQALRQLTIRDQSGRVYLRERLSILIRRHAILGSAPPWQAEKSTVRQVQAHGKPRYFILDDVTGAEIDGYDRKRHRPKAGAYTKNYLDPDPTDAAVARGEYELWHAALSAIAEELAGRLDEFDIAPPEKPARPWQEGAAPGPRILADRRVPQPVVTPSRPLAGPREPRRRAAPVRQRKPASQAALDLRQKD